MPERRQESNEIYGSKHIKLYIYMYVYNRNMNLFALNEALKSEDEVGDV